MRKRILFLEPFQRFSDLALLFMRLGVGAFLVWGVWDNITETNRLTEFVQFLSNKGFVLPGTMAWLTIFAQFVCGVSFISGLFSRWAGLLCAFNFIVALVMVDAAEGIRVAFPAGILVLFGFFVATYGGGRYALDSLFDGRSSSLTSA